VSEVAESAKKTYEATSEDEPLDRIKGTLSESLKGMKVPLLVVMDDVDRLTNEEIRLLFQVIKVNADFPKVVYLLLFDRSIVEKALQGFGGASGRDYLEKIVQAGFELPKVDRSDLDRMFLSGLNQILSFEGANRTFDSERWARLYIYGLKPIVKTPRHVRRFLSAFSFAVGLFYREQTLEVNVIDLIAIEALRIFEPDLYHKLPERKGFLLGETALSLLRDEVKDDHNKEFERLIEVVVDEDRAAVTAVLRELFPLIDWLLKGYEVGQGFEGGWLREIRICHQDLFDRYFALLVPKGDVPQSWIDRLIGVAGDRTAMLEELSRLRESGRLDQALSRLESYASEIDMGVALPFVTALMDIGDSLQTRGLSLLEIGPDMTTYFTVYNYLAREKDSKARGHILLGAIEATEGLFLPVMVVSSDLDRRERRNPSPPLFDDEDLERAKKLCTDKIQRAASEGKLLASGLLHYLFRWRELAGDDAPRQYVGSLIASPEGALRFLKGVNQEARGPGVGEVRKSSRRIINLKHIEPFVDLRRLQDVLEPFLKSDASSQSATLAGQYHKEISAFRLALGHEEAGAPDGTYDNVDG